MAGKFSDYREAATEPEKKSTLLNCGCEVWGCNQVGATQSDGRWNCRYHRGVHGDRLASVTLVIKNHPNEIRFLEKLHSLKPYDFDVPAICDEAPYGMKKNEGEAFAVYRGRVQKQLFSGNPPE